MKRGMMICAAIAATVAVSGCATKRYPIATPLSESEVRLMDCRDLELEMVRAQQVQQQIVETAETDWRSVAGFLGDYGIGNAMARSEADTAIGQRMMAIREAQARNGCLSDVEIGQLQIDRAMMAAGN